MHELGLEIAATAQTYLGTPFHWHGRLKGVGIDCAGLPICVGRELGLFAPDFDLRDYGNYPVAMGETLRKYCQEISKAEMAIGDILCFRFHDQPQHAGILTPIGVIHSSIRWAVVEHVLDDEWLSRIQLVFRYPSKI
jgi:cell wall-associated NlpC family hydrolase